MHIDHRTYRATQSDDERRDCAHLLSLAVRESIQALDEIELPLHILLENHFGDLNENQEEMLGAARAAAARAGHLLHQLINIAELDAGAVTIRHDRVRPADLVAALLPALRAEGEQRSVRVTAEVDPAIAPLSGDRTRLQMAFELLLTDALRRTAAGGVVTICARAAPHAVVVDVHHGGGRPRAIDQALARRLIAVHRGSTRERVAASVARGGDAPPGASGFTTTIEFPV